MGFLILQSSNKSLKWQINFIFRFQVGKTAAVCTSLSAGLVVSVISYIKNPTVSGESAPSVMLVGHPWDNSGVTTDWHFPL